MTHQKYLIVWYCKECMGYNVHASDESIPLKTGVRCGYCIHCEDPNATGRVAACSRNTYYVKGRAKKV